MSTSESSFDYPQAWRPGTGPNSGRWTCILCKDDKWRGKPHALRHENTLRHREHLTEMQDRNQPLLAAERELPPQAAARHDRDPSEVVGPLLQTLRELTSPASVELRRRQRSRSLSFQSSNRESAFGETTDFPASDQDFTSEPLGINLEAPPDEAAINHIAESLTSWLANGPTVVADNSSDDDAEERSDESSSKESDDLARGAPRPRQSASWTPSEMWYPWPDKVTCVLDLLHHLPRSTFSRKQKEIIDWAMQFLGVPHVPPASTMKTIEEMLQNICGIRTLRYEGALGHVYYCNDLSALIAQEMANPQVRPHLRFLPEDAGSRLNGPHQGRHMLKDMDPDLMTPMVRIGTQDFYIYEPARLSDDTLCVPIRWFERQQAVYAKAWRIHPVWYNGLLGWVVHQHEIIEISATNLLTSFPYLCTSFEQRNIPDPRNIFGIIRAPGGPMDPWSFTNPSDGNRWRELAKGHRVYAFPIWLYCDDTSGNLSKRWNKHNSFLFTAAGLPHDQAHCEYNVHFLSTSNIAPPLEMLDGVVDQLEAGQDSGIWAWDCVDKDMVLLIPSVLAMLGDNPMQSELSCHVGLGGKYFCRSCFVKGQENLDESERGNREDGSDNSSVATGHGTDGTDDSGDLSKRKRKKPETRVEMIDRVRRFMTINKAREKDDSITKLRSIFTTATSVGGKTKAKKMKTEAGLKDMYQDHFSDLIFNMIKGLRGSRQVKQARIDDLVKQLPASVSSPVWRIRGLDPHRDTPVEILHVILLGFVKYFWRDVMLRITTEQKSLLITRLNSLDVSGLGIPPLAGRTLVQYAGSLTGRDFRVIAQAAPFVLFDLIPQKFFDAWLALSAMIPLIWQPVIEDIDEHVSKIERAIDHFLTCTARWTPRWFNKPKFHIILHLPEHIRRFGPAILFATETFESYNALIRSFSVHSNRQAPSRDIGLGFAHHNRLRHLLSGGWFHISAAVATRSTHVESNNKSELTVEDFRQVGAAPAAMIASDPKLQAFCGFPNAEKIRKSGVTFEDSTPKTWQHTRASRLIPTEMARTSRAASYMYKICASARLGNGDKCATDSFALVRDPTQSLPFVGKIVEILQIPGSASERNGWPTFILVRRCSTEGIAAIYCMPRLTLTDSYAMANHQDFICTVNVQHNCAAQVEDPCSPAHTRIIVQERELTSRLEATMKHSHPHDIVLNTAQMRDSVHLQHFRIEAATLDKERAVEEGVIAEIAASKKKSQTQPASTTILQTQLRASLGIGGGRNSRPRS